MTTLAEMGTQVKDTARVLATMSTEKKNEALRSAADELLSASATILGANQQDVASAANAGTASSALDRLRLDKPRLESMADGLVAIAALPDPVGEITDGWVRPNGLSIRRTRVPLGVLGVIYENRPNVTSDAAGLCLKSGNGAFLRGSSAALRSNIAIVQALRAGLRTAELPEGCITLVQDTSRRTAIEFMGMRDSIDCLIPRGGKGLISSVLEHAKVPYIIDGDGNCHVYVDASANLDMAISIVVNAKTQRTSVCNAAESLVLHSDVAQRVLARLEIEMPQVALVGDERAVALSARVGPADDDDFAAEFLDFKMSVKVVDDIGGAIDHINRYGSGHTEAIVASHVGAVNRFTNEVDAAVVAVNASTRFTDGGEFGFGAEIGNSTQKLHCRGPMGLRELTTLKYIVEGNGHIRT